MSRIQLRQAKHSLLHRSGIETTVEAIWTALMDPEFRKSAFEDLKPVAEQYRNQIRAAVIADEPIKFVLIAFPFKMWRNPLKTNRITPDLGEFSFLATLVRIDQCIRAVYAPGAAFDILTEGDMYREIMQVPADEATAYLEQVKYFASQLPLTVQWHSCHSALMSFPDFPAACARVRQLYADNQRTVPEEIAWTFFASQDVRHINHDLLVRLYREKEPVLSASDQEVKERLERQAQIMAVEYLAINEAKHLVGNGGAIQTLFPNHLYVSITKKVGRYAFHAVSRKTRNLPHHGVPVLRADGLVAIYWLDDIRRFGGDTQYHPVCLDGESDPFYYQEVKPGEHSQR